MKKTLRGIVVSDSMEKTVGVETFRIDVHPLYEKRMKKKKKYLAHNEIGAKVGDRVEIEATRPISKRKKWIVKQILSHGRT